MKAKIDQSKKRRYLVPGIALGLLLTFVFPLVLTTRALTPRGAPAVDGQIAYATISVGQLEYTNMTHRHRIKTRFSVVFIVSSLGQLSTSASITRMATKAQGDC